MKEAINSLVADSDNLYICYEHFVHEAEPDIVLHILLTYYPVEYSMQFLCEMHDDAIITLVAVHMIGNQQKKLAAALDISIQSEDWLGAQ